jgi:hypothetical protein
MTKKYANRWIYAVAAALFFFTAVINGWILLDEGIAPLRIIAVAALMMHGSPFAGGR